MYCIQFDWNKRVGFFCILKRYFSSTHCRCVTLVPTKRRILWWVSKLTNWEIVFNAFQKPCITTISHKNTETVRHSFIVQSACRCTTDTVWYSSLYACFDTLQFSMHEIKHEMQYLLFSLWAVVKGKRCHRPMKRSLVAVATLYVNFIQYNEKKKYYNIKAFLIQHILIRKFSFKMVRCIWTHYWGFIQLLPKIIFNNSEKRTFASMMWNMGNFAFQQFIRTKANYAYCVQIYFQLKILFFVMRNLNMQLFRNEIWDPLHFDGIVLSFSSEIIILFSWWFHSKCRHINQFLLVWHLW